jgi:hypothetical protein
MQGLVLAQKVAWGLYRCDKFGICKDGILYKYGQDSILLYHWTMWTKSAETYEQTKTTFDS